MPNPAQARAASAVLLAAALAACSAANPRHRAASEPEGFVITAEDITRSGARNGWEAVRMGGSHLLIRENTHADQARTTLRGANSLVLSNQVLVVVDGAHLGNWTFLRDLPADNIDYIQVLSGPAGTFRYGTPGGNGVIVVKTRVPPQ